MWEDEDAAALRRGLRTLYDAGLIELLQGGEEPRYRQHALLRAYALEALPETERAAALERHSAAYLALARQLKRQMQWPAFPAILPQATAALERAWRAVDASALPDEDRNSARERVDAWVDALGEFWEVSGQYSLRAIWEERAAACDRALGNREYEGNRLGNLANAFAALGEPRKAMEYYEQALAIDREIGDRRGEGADLGNLGNAYADLGETRKAIEYHVQALAIAREIGDRRGEGADLGNLGIAYRRLDDVPKAIEYYGQQLVIVREIGDRNGESNALNNLGVAFNYLGDTEKATTNYEEALAIAEAIGYRSGAARSHYNLGETFADLGRVEEARAHFQAALELYTAIERTQDAADAQAELEKLR
jgi:tetratricopeptide (TPR) repeat protein